LNNGLQVHTVRRPQDETVSVQLWLPAGSRYEGTAPAGVATAVAELTRRSAASQLPSTAALNTWVEADATVFSLTTTPVDLDETLGLLASAVDALDISASHIKAGRRAQESVAQALRAAPDRHVLEALLSDAYSPNGLGRAPLGGDPAAWGPAALSQFHKTHYGPRGAYLVFVGPDTAEANLGRARNHWDRWSGATQPRPKEPQPSTPPRIRVDRSEAGQGRIRIAIRITPTTPREAAIYDLIARLLDTPFKGRIAKAARTYGVDLNATHSFVFAPIGPGQLILGLDGDPESVDRIWSVATHALASLQELPPTGGELTDCRTVLLAAERRGHATPDSYAERVGRGLMRWPDDPHGTAWRDAVETVTAEDVAKTARALLDKDLFTAVIAAPPSTNTAKDGFWAESLNEHLDLLAGKGPISNDAGRIELRPGLEVVAHPMGQAGVVAIHMALNAGSQTEAPHELGVGRMATSILETLAGKAHVRLYPSTIEASILSDATALEGDLVDLAAALGGDRWSPAIFETARTLAVERTRDQLRSTDRSARALASGFSRKPVAEQIAALETMGATAVRPWFDTYLAGGDATIAVVGAVDPDRAYRAVRAAFMQTIRRQQGVTLRGGDEPPAMVRRATDGGLAHHWQTFQLDVTALEDYAVLTVIGELLSNSTTTPGITIQNALAGGQGQWAIGLSRAPEDIESARLQMARELETLRGGPLPDEVIRQAAQQAMARETMRLRHPGVRARWLVEQARAKRSLTGSRAVALWRAAIGRVVPADVHGLVQKRLARPQSEINVGPQPRLIPSAKGGTQ